jgi:hypothetical protein
MVIGVGYATSPAEIEVASTVRIVLYVKSIALIAMLVMKKIATNVIPIMKLNQMKMEIGNVSVSQDIKKMLVDVSRFVPLVVRNVIAQIWMLVEFASPAILLKAILKSPVDVFLVVMM